MLKLFYIFLLFFMSSCYQNTGKPAMLWEISGNKLDKPSYLFGTFHTKDPNLNALSSTVISALKRSQRLYTEIPMNEKSTREVMTFSKMTHPTDLKTRLHPKTLKLLLKHIKRYKLPHTPNTLKPYKTWAIGLMLNNQYENTKHSNMLFMDENIVKIAKSYKIKQSALETPIEQLKYLDTLSPSSQEQFVIDALTQQDDTAYNDALKNWYSNGQEEGFYEIQKLYASDDPKQKKLDKALFDGLLLERNQKLTRRINILLDRDPQYQYFFAIGAGHLSGEKGIISKLKMLGYTLRKTD